MLICPLLIWLSRGWQISLKGRNELSIFNIRKRKVVLHLVNYFLCIPAKMLKTIEINNNMFLISGIILQATANSIVFHQATSKEQVIHIIIITCNIICIVFLLKR